MPAPCTALKPLFPSVKPIVPTEKMRHQKLGTLQKETKLTKACGTVPIFCARSPWNPQRHLFSPSLPLFPSVQSCWVVEHER